MGKNTILPPKLFLRIFAGLCLVAHVVRPQTAEKSITPCELETIIRELIEPNIGYEMHAASLRNQLKKILENQSENYQTLDDSEELEEDKRSLSSLAREGFLNGKRNIGALARAGILRGASSDDIKRSIATLAKNGQLPSKEPDAEVAPSARWMDDKRNIGSLAKSGYFTYGKRNIASLARSYELPSYGKRNIASIVRSGMIPAYGSKRSVSALARANMLPYNSDYASYKRNIGAVARDWALPNHQNKMNEKRDIHQDKDEKRNIGALKNSPVHGRKKREIQYNDFDLGTSEIAEPVVQTSPIDYEELIDAIDEDYPFDHNEEKRFLGSVARSGWYRYRPMEKRHIGSLARVGLLHNDIARFADQKQSSYRQEMDKRHIGALARTDITTHKSDFNNPSQAFVDDAIHNIQIPLAGVHQDYKQIGEHHPDSQHYIGEILEDPYTQQEQFINNNNNNINTNNNNNQYLNPINFYDYIISKQLHDNDMKEMNCMKRLKNLLNDIINNNNNNDNNVDEYPYLEHL